MNNLEAHMKTVDDIHITKKERKYLLQEAINILGVERRLTMVVEEIAELMNVLSSNIVNDFDYIHTAEEITDVLMSIKTVSMILHTNIPKPNELDIGKPRMKLITWYMQLSKAQQYIIKYIRNGSVARDKLQMAQNILVIVTHGVIEFCGIEKKDISKIETIKFKRLQDRIRNKELK